MTKEPRRPRISYEVWKKFNILAAQNDTSAEYEIEKALEIVIKNAEKESSKNGKPNK